MLVWTQPPSEVRVLCCSIWIWLLGSPNKFGFIRVARTNFSCGVTADNLYTCFFFRQPVFLFVIETFMFSCVFTIVSGIASFTTWSVGIVKIEQSLDLGPKPI